MSTRRRGGFLDEHTKLDETFTEGYIHRQCLGRSGRSGRRFVMVPVVLWSRRQAPPVQRAQRATAKALYYSNSVITVTSVALSVASEHNPKTAAECS